MRNVKKKILAIVTICTFAALMMLNVNTTFTDSNFSVNGLISLAYGSSSGNSDCTGSTWHPDCAIWEIEYRPGAPVGERVTCTTGGDYSCSNG